MKQNFIENSISFPEKYEVFSLAGNNKIYSQFCNGIQDLFSPIFFSSDFPGLRFLHIYELNWTHLKTPVEWSSLCTILTSLIWCLMNLSFLKCQLYQLNSGGSPDSAWISSPFLCPVNFLLTKCWLTIHSTVFISHYTGITVLCCLALNDLRSVILYIIFTFFKIKFIYFN